MRPWGEILILTNVKTCDWETAASLLQEILQLRDVPLLWVIPPDGRGYRGRANRYREVHLGVEAFNFDVDAASIKLAQIGEEELEVVRLLAIHQAEELHLGGQGAL